MQRRLILLPTAILAATLTACSDDSGETFTVYSGREEELIGPLIDQLEDDLGTEVEVRYGDSAELAAQLLEEGDSTDADLFFSQDAGALGALAGNGMLANLDESVLDQVDAKYRDADGQWVATSARARVVAYNPDLAPEVTEMDSVDDLLDDQYANQIGFAPTNASFQAFVTALRVQRGDDAARAWLEDFAALDPEAFDENSDILAAVDRGEIAAGLINHYYWHQAAAETGADNMTAQIHYLDSDDPGALINVAGVGVIESADDTDTAGDAVEFLLSEQAQTFFADETAEYPVVDGISSQEHDLQPLTQLQGPDIDLNDLESLQETLTMLEEVGLT